MPLEIPAVSSDVSINWSRLKAYLVLGLVLYAGAMGAIAWKGKLLFAVIGLSAPALFLIISQPRAVMYLFVFLLYVQWEVIPSLPLSITDLGAMLVVFTALLDVLLSDRPPGRLPRFFGNYLLILAALLVAGIFGYSFMLSTRPLARVTLLFATFLGVYRLSARVSLIGLVRMYFWICTAHACIALTEFLAHGGRMRAFGLLPTTLDDFTMIALPIGVALYLWSNHEEAGRYLLGSVVVLGALVATQSRATIVFGIIAALLTAVVSFKRARTLSADSAHALSAATAGNVRRRLKTIVGIALALIVTLVVLKPEFLAAVGARFDRLITTQPGETFRLRLILWQLAITTFAQHPLLGIGPGVFRSLPEIDPMLHLEPLLYYVRGLSAHNLLLHYLAEAGLVGAVALVALFFNQFRQARRLWLNVRIDGETNLNLILYMISGLLLFTTFLEAGWMWGELGFVAAFFIALIARRSSDSLVASRPQVRV